MLKHIVSAFAAASLLAACASTPAARAPAPAAVITEPEIAALIELMRLEDTRTFDDAAFQRLAQSGSPLIRARAALAMGRIGQRAAVPVLITASRDSAGDVRANAAFALGEIADSSADVVEALNALAWTRGAAAVEAIHALGKTGGSQARAHIEELLRKQKPGPEVQEALLAMWHFRRTPASREVLLPYTRADDAELRWRAVYSLVRGGPDPANVTAFQTWLRDPHPMVRQLAARGLRAATADSAGQRPAAAAALAAALKDPDAQVRINAVGVLAGYRDPQYAEAVTALLHDSVPNVRMAAAGVLQAFAGQDLVAARAAYTLARDSTQPAALRGLALQALTALSPNDAIPLLQSFRNSSDALLRLYAARAVTASRTPETLGFIRALAADRDVRVRTQAINSMAAVAGDTSSFARAFFIENLANADPYVRAAALDGLQDRTRDGDEAIVMEAFQRALQDSTEESGMSAVRVLAKLAQSNAAVTRTFATRFPIESIPNRQVRTAAARQILKDTTCCALPVQTELYERVVRQLLVPALQGGPLPRVRVSTAPGVFEMELLGADAPITVDNFMRLTRAGYFNNGRWHRVVPNFVLQDGDPTGTGSGGPGYAIRDEMNRVRYLRGTLGMALSGPDTGGSQWFVTHSPQPHLDGGYTVFGRVVSGMDVADRVIQEDPITSIAIIE